jgi:hypothetical protein
MKFTIDSYNSENVTLDEKCSKNIYCSYLFQTYVASISIRIGIQFTDFEVLSYTIHIGICRNSYKFPTQKWKSYMKRECRKV